MPFLGEIRSFASSELPPGWLPCDGRLLDISRYQGLFALLGTTYGGNGISKFALPDLRGRTPAGLDNRAGQPLGATSGHASQSGAVIPYAVAHWGIADRGEFPSGY